jgi:tripartite-type tricarboxylate transporter receptor subunit TctC
VSHLLVLSLTFLITGENVAVARKFLGNPVQIIIPFQPGSTDVLLRPLVEKMPEYLGQPDSYILKPGASGSFAPGFVVAAKPDGYTLLGACNSSEIKNN